ncbi:macrolide transporter subunit MacA [Stieleria maiorica]|uniref:Macrolide transporter subunit MacA n=1 Tax=Stieleria maiorica TaxID=2795974 RepID=A0A5B9M756_9BACT|nr:efflux RND transporter periplasmic adaptor subunit [Stieleria maiorica]QEF97028.1 macrolide transporter subunit MacA [Stieleria maiorica]
MATEISNTGSGTGDPILVGAGPDSTGPKLSAPKLAVPDPDVPDGCDGLAAPRRRAADVAGIASSNSPFGSAVNHQDASERLLERLDELSVVIAAVIFGIDSDDQLVLPQPLRLDPSDRNAQPQLAQLMSVCQQTASSGQVHSRRQLSPERVLIAFPIATGSDLPQVLGLMVALPDDLQRFTQSVLGLTEQFAIDHLQHRLQRQAELASDAAATVELLTRALATEDHKEACQVIVTELADHLQLRRAAIGMTSKGSRSCRLVALSDSTRIDASTAQTRLIENVMDEALLSGAITMAGSATGGHDAARNAAELARLHAATVLVVPLADAPEQPRAVLLAIIDSDRSVQPVRQFLHAAQNSLGAVLNALQTPRSSQTVRRLGRAVKSRSGSLAIAAGVLLLASLFIRIPHRETCDVRVEPRTKRFVAAPFDATLKECFVEPGDVVRQGDLLATLDGRELKWKRESLQADHDQAVKKRDAAQASRAYADQRIAQLEIDALRSELNLLDLRLSELQLRSPVDGMVVAGDLKRATGAPLTTGQSLFEVAPLDEMIIEASVRDDRIAYVQKDQPARLRLNAYPQRSWDARIEIVNPRSEIRDEENVFIAQCTLPNEQQLLRPGMKGTLKIDCGRRALGWVWFHRPAEAVSQWFWW